MKLNILDLGQMDYKEALDIQHRVLEKVQEGEDDTLILVEHPPVITLGRNAQENNVLFSEEALKKDGISLYNIERGGDVTYHGPGQLVGYPIFNLKKNHGRSIKRFIDNLEEIFIQYLLKEHNTTVSRHDCNAGVWFGEEKIVALGLAVKRGVTFHGFAFNISTNLQHFNYIVPCGLSKMGVTSLETIHQKSYELDVIKEGLVDYFKTQYEFTDVKKKSLEDF
jgi:lipoyl(octanoyl) transferase